MSETDSWVDVEFLTTLFELFTEDDESLYIAEAETHELVKAYRAMNSVSTNVFEELEFRLMYEEELADASEEDIEYMKRIAGRD